MNEETKLETVAAPSAIARANHTPFAELQQMAKHVAASGLFGVKTESQAIALMLLAQAEGMHPMVAARDYHIIEGKPSKKARAMLADFLSRGGKVEWHQRDDDAADATFSTVSGGTIRVRWTKEMAKDAGFLEKSVWKKHRRQMLSARTISEGVNTVDPGATSGLYTPEEVEQFDGPRNAPAPAYHAELMPDEAPMPEKNITPNSGTNTHPTPEDDHQAEMKKTALATIMKEQMKVGIGSNQMNELMMALGHADGTVPADLNTRADLMAVYKAVKGWWPPPAPPATALDDSPPKVQPAALIADILGLIDDHDLDLNATTLRLYLPAKIEDMDEKQLKMLQKDLQTQAKGKKS